MRLLLSCSELGLGHVSRLIPLGKRLAERGHEPFFFAGGVPYELLKKEFEHVYPCRPVAWYEGSVGVMASASVLNILFPLPQFNYDANRLELKSPSADETIQRYYDLRRHILEIKPELIVADGDLHAVRLGSRWAVPPVFVTNVIRPSYRFSPLLVPGERFTERYLRSCRRIIVPDNLQHTICEYSLGDLEQVGVKNRVEFVGSFLDMTPDTGSAEHIFASISGPPGTRAKLASMILPVLSRLQTKSIVSLGEPGRGKAVKKYGNCEAHSWLTQPERDECMRNAEMIIFSGGHGTCFEVIKHGKPSVCIPTQPEQMGNARKLQELGCSVSVDNSSQLRSAILDIEEKAESYKRNVRRIQEYSRRFRGVEEAVNVIEDVL